MNLFSFEFVFLFFIFLFVFFVSISFSMRITEQLFWVFIFWRLSMELFNRAFYLFFQESLQKFTLLGQNEFIDFDSFLVGYFRLFFALSFFLLFFSFLKRRVFFQLPILPWTVRFLINLSLAGFLISSVLVIFAWELEQRIGTLFTQLFLHPYSQIAWFFLLFFFMVFPPIFLKKSYRKIPFRRR